MSDDVQQKNTNLAELRNQTARELAAPDQRVDLFSQRGFALAQRLAQAFSTSDAVPAIFQAQVPKKDKGVVVAWVENAAAFGNCLIAIETAQSVGMSITAVMQNANIIEGKLSWSGKFIIAAVNASRRFTPLRFDMQNKGVMKATYKEKDGWNNEKKKFNMVEHVVEIENLECVAWALPYGMDFPPGVNTLRKAKDAGLPVIEGPKVSMKLAVEEGWYAKPGSKWQTDMKDMMLLYRSGAYFGNIHAPDVVMGMGRSTEEAQDMSTIDVERQPDGRYAANMDDLRAGAAEPKPSEVVAETVTVNDKTLEPEPVARTVIDQESMTDEVRAAYESVAAQLQKSASLDALAVAADLIGTVGHAGLRAELTAMYKRYLEELSAPKEAKAKEADAAPVKRTRRATGAAPE